MGGWNGARLRIVRAPAPRASAKARAVTASDVSPWASTMSAGTSADAREPAEHLGRTARPSRSLAPATTTMQFSPASSTQTIA